MSSFQALKASLQESGEVKGIVRTFITHPAIRDTAIRNVDDHPMGRHYYVNGDQHVFPSVTNVIGKVGDLTGANEWLEAWRERVGAEEAARVGAKASMRGTQLHDMCELYLSNRTVRNVHNDAWKLFKVMMPELRKIDNIRALENALYCPVLKVAGRCDCIGEYEEDESVIDFKSSKRVKSEKDIYGYRVQVSLYSMMYESMTGHRTILGQIMMGCDRGEGSVGANWKPTYRTYPVLLNEQKEAAIDMVATYWRWRGDPIDVDAAKRKFLG